MRLEKLVDSSRKLVIILTWHILPCSSGQPKLAHLSSRKWVLVTTPKPLNPGRSTRDTTDPCKASAKRRPPRNTVITKLSSGDRATTTLHLSSVMMTKVTQDSTNYMRTWQRLNTNRCPEESPSRWSERGSHLTGSRRSSRTSKTSEKRVKKEQFFTLLMSMSSEEWYRLWQGLTTLRFWTYVSLTRLHLCLNLTRTCSQSEITTWKTRRSQLPSPRKRNPRKPF